MFNLHACTSGHAVRWVVLVQAPRFETGEQDGRTEPIGIVKGVMEKLARHELLSRALQEDRLNDLTLNASVA